MFLRKPTDPGLSERLGQVEKLSSAMQRGRKLIKESHCSQAGHMQVAIAVINQEVNEQNK